MTDRFIVLEKLASDAEVELVEVKAQELADAAVQAPAPAKPGQWIWRRSIGDFSC